MIVIIEPIKPGTISYKLVEDLKKIAQITVIKKPLHMPATAPALVVPFQNRERKTTGQKAQPKPDQANSTNQNINLLSDNENQKAAIPTITVINFPRKTIRFWVASGLRIF